MPGKQSKKNQRIDSAILVAIIGLIGTLTVALVNASPIQNWWNSRLNSTPIPNPTMNTVSTPISLPSDTPVEQIFTLSPMFTETFPPSSANIPSATLPPNIGTMKAQVFYNYGTGNAPLQASFDASTSFVSYPDGSSVDCTFSNVCTFSWDVRIGSNSIYGPVVDDAKFAYTFQKKGDYTVVVYVCREEICNFAAASVVVK